MSISIDQILDAADEHNASDIFLQEDDFPAKNQRADPRVWRAACVPRRIDRAVERLQCRPEA